MLDLVDQPGTLGLATYDRVYGSQILTSNNVIVTAKYQVAYDNDALDISRYF